MAVPKKDFNFEAFPNGGGGGSSKPTTSTTEDKKEDYYNPFENHIGSGNSNSGGTITPNAPDYSSILNELREQANKRKEEQMANLNQYMDLIKDQNYKELYDADIALGVAKERALANTNRALQASGFGGQGGILGTNLTQNNNAYLNARQTNQNNFSNAMNEAYQSYLSSKENIESNYNSDLNDLAMQEAAWEREDYYNQLQQQQNQSSASWDNLLGTLSIYAQKGNQDSIKRVLQNYGYLDSEGNPTALYDSLSQTQKGDLQTALMGGLESDEDVITDDETLSYLELPTEGTIYYFTSDGSSTKGDVTSTFSDEITKLTEMIGNYQVEDGTAFKLVNGNNGSYVYVLYKGGRTYTVPKSVYDSATSKKTIEDGYLVDTTSSNQSNNQNPSQSYNKDDLGAVLTEKATRQFIEKFIQLNGRSPKNFDTYKTTDYANDNKERILIYYNGKFYQAKYKN